MKKLINKIKSWFIKEIMIPEHDVLFAKCDNLAKKYGSICAYVSLCKIYYAHRDGTGIAVYVQDERLNICISLSFNEDKVDHEQVLAKFELELISKYGKAKNL